MFRLPVVAKLLYHLAPPLAFLEQFSQGYLRYSFLALSPKNFCQLKYNSQLLGYMYFVSQQYISYLFYSLIY